MFQDSKNQENLQKAKDEEIRNLKSTASKAFANFVKNDGGKALGEIIIGGVKLAVLVWKIRKAKKEQENKGPEQ